MTSAGNVEVAVDATRSGGGGAPSIIARLLNRLIGERRIAFEVLRTAPTPYIVTGGGGNVWMANDAALALFGGVRPGVSIREALREIASDVEFLSHVARCDSPASRTVVVSRGDGEHWYEVSVRHLERPRAGLIWRLQEISDRKRREAAHLAENDALARTLRDLDVGYCLLGPEGEFHTVSDILAGWLGFAPDELIGRDAREVMGDGAVALLTGPISNGDLAPPLIVRRLSHRGGDSVHVSVVRIALDEEVFGPGHIRCLVRNLSRESDRAVALQMAEHRFRILFECAPFAAMTLDGEGQVTEANAAFRSMVPDQPLIGRRVVELIAEDDREAVESLIATTWSGRAESSGIDVRSEPTFAGNRLLQVFASRLAEGEGDATGLLLHVMDVTEQRGLESQFAQAQKMQAVGQLAGGVAHDFNNLLTTIIGHTDLLMLRIQPGDEAFPDIMQIKQNANRAANLVRQLLAFSRQQTLRPTVLDLTEVMAELTHLLRRLIGENIELKVAHGRDLGLVKVDQNQFEQVIINLAVNARDAMAGGGRLEIRTENIIFDQPQAMEEVLIPAGHYVHLSVRDTGTGIAPDSLGKIFEPFYTTKPQGSGTGLGLSMVYGIIRQTGGFVHAESAVGTGTTFHIYIPHHREAVAPAPAPASAPQARDLSGNGTILLVEDEDAVRKFAARALRNKGYMVLDCASGEVALETLRRHDGEIDLVISDVVMPQINGPTLVKSIRAEYPTLKVIFISGYAEQAFRQKLTEGGDHDLLPKPFSLRELAAKVKDVMARDAAAA